MGEHLDKKTVIDLFKSVMDHVSQDVSDGFVDFLEMIDCAIVENPRNKSMGLEVKYYLYDAKNVCVFVITVTNTFKFVIYKIYKSKSCSMGLDVKGYVCTFDFNATYRSTVHNPGFDDLELDYYSMILANETLKDKLVLVNLSSKNYDENDKHQGYEYKACNFKYTKNHSFSSYFNPYGLETLIVDYDKDMNPQSFKTHDNDTARQWIIDSGVAIDCYGNVAYPEDLAVFQMSFDIFDEE